MRLSNAVARVAAVVLWCGVSGTPNKAFAEKYEAITEFPDCFLMGGKEGCEKQGDPKKSEMARRPNVDDTDVKACEVITQNINEMEKYNIDWNCDFPISGNISLLSKPHLVQVDANERKEAMKAKYKYQPVIKPDERDIRPVFRFQYDANSDGSDDTIYIMPRHGGSVHEGYPAQCTSEARGVTPVFWSPSLGRLQNDGYPVVVFSNLYWIQYIHDFYHKGFYPVKIIEDGRQMTSICTIKPVNADQK